MEIRVCSWNIWGGKYLPQVIDFLRRESFDVIALQEVEETGDGGQSAQAIAEALGYSYAYVRSMEYADEGKRTYRGNAIVSRFPIEQNMPLRLSSESSRTAIRADISVQGGIIHVASVHLIHAREQPSPIQEAQVSNLVRLVPNERTVVMGDFNALPESGTVARMTEAFRHTDAHGLPSWCLYPDGSRVALPDQVRWKLDYVFVTRDIAYRDFRVWQTDGSDHLPVSVVLTLP